MPFFVNGPRYLMKLASIGREVVLDGGLITAITTGLLWIRSAAEAMESIFPPSGPYRAQRRRLSPPGAYPEVSTNPYDQIGLLAGQVKMALKPSSWVVDERKRILFASRWYDVKVVSRWNNKRRNKVVSFALERNEVKVVSRWIDKEVHQFHRERKSPQTSAHRKSTKTGSAPTHTAGSTPRRPAGSKRRYDLRSKR